MHKHFAIVTGASSGIGFEIAKLCAQNGFDLLIAAESSKINEAATALRLFGHHVEAVEADLSTIQGVDKLYDAVKGRKVDVLVANAGVALGHAFLDQDFCKVHSMINVNIVGTIYLIHKVGHRMRECNDGKILVTGSIAGLAPGPFMAVYNGTKAFINSFTEA